MSCRIPPKLDNSQLLAYLVGHAPPEVHQHLEQCPDCRSRLATLQRWQSWLMKNLYRTPCPSSLQLGEYRLRMLSEEQQARIEQHLVWCPACRSDVQLFGGEQVIELDSSVNFLQQIVERVRIVVARLREDLTSLPLEVPTAALAGVRGEETAKSLTYNADELEISLLLQTDFEHPGQRMLLGWIAGQENDQTIEVYLWREVQQIATITVDSLGNFAFSNLSPGQYKLILYSDTREIYIDGLDL